MIEIVREKDKSLVYVCCPNCGYWYVFRACDLEEAFPDGTFDCVWCYEDVNYLKEGFKYRWKE